jgi:NAD(P)-dependent dehydrogenase (short-subunit alcohol dehydrogenase family)
MEKKNIFVVGGSSGIGLEIVRILSQDGHNVFVGSRKNDRLKGLEGVNHLKLDVTAESLHFDGLPNALDGMVYCPGTIQLRPFQRLSVDDFMADLKVNYLGAVKSIQGVIKRLKKSKSVSSVVLFSTVAVNTGMPFHASIAGAKGAVEGLTRSLAAEFAPRIRFNAIAPSLTDTPLAQLLLSSDEKRKASADRHPLKRIGSAREIAGVAVHLLSEDSAWITGQVFFVDGGMSSVKTFK